MSDFSGQKAPSNSNNNSNASLVISMLPDAVLGNIFTFLGNGQYRYVAGTCKHFRKVYHTTLLNEWGTKTFWAAAAESTARAQLVVDDYERLGKDESDIETELVEISIGAATIGNVNVLEWFLHNGGTFIDDHFYLVGRHGHTSVLEWIQSLNLSWHVVPVLHGAAQTGKVGVLEWMFVNRPHALRALEADGWGDMIYSNAADSGRSPNGDIICHIPVLQWLRDKNLMSTYAKRDLWSIAFERGVAEVIDWLADKESVPPALEIRTIPDYDVIPTLTRAKSLGVVFTKVLCFRAALYGNLDALQWLRANGCPWSWNVLWGAQTRRHHHVVEWARENGCPEPPTFVWFL